ncbi:MULTISPECIES: hypothetical protein [unclassified Roseateles]|uniref:hypothetical protein n=1 Tax=unclassified Roseateles TaxID=2626991 RepID=UPI0006F4B323|nr:MULTISPECIES: hypothetical protein [unclassified Roseateles]KQW45500.1 hypothetical protein ASC81_11355 [Pelomonas sp. Root405]KRA72344.1 hypothetical protein ASD88_11355 [Pelomonas sp. Root662]
MPITPFHFGPGAALHALAPRHVSFLAFCAANGLIDVESLYNLVHGRQPVHAFFHTYVGASLVALGIAALFRAWLRLMRGRFSGGLGLRQVVIGATLGAWTHVLLDSVMHADIQPLQPLSAANGLYRIVSLSALHWGCIAAGALALLVIGVRRLRATRQ